MECCDTNNGGTPLVCVYDAFLTRITADEWTVEEDMAIVERDWMNFLDIAIFRFKFPRVSLDYDPCRRCFLEEITQAEIQVLATYMKHEWVKRCVASWENIRQLYSDTDFSQANHLDKLLKTSQDVYEECIHMYAVYDRARKNQPTGFMGLAGGGKV